MSGKDSYVLGLHTQVGQPYRGREPLAEEVLEENQPWVKVHSFRFGPGIWGAFDLSWVRCNERSSRKRSRLFFPQVIAAGLTRVGVRPRKVYGAEKRVMRNSNIRYDPRSASGSGELFGWLKGETMFLVSGTQSALGECQVWLLSLPFDHPNLSFPDTMTYG